MIPSIQEYHRLHSSTTVEKKKVATERKLNWNIRWKNIVFIFWANHILRLLITPEGALQHNASIFTGIESGQSNCTILCSSHTHKYMHAHTFDSHWLIAAEMCLDINVQPSVQCVTEILNRISPVYHSPCVQAVLLWIFWSFLKNKL